MQTKNVYIAYPPGYHGSYVSWAISISDKDSYPSTVKNPINSSPSTQFGGAGTSHLHVRVPTHQGISYHMSWQMFNKKLDDHRCYIANVQKFNSTDNMRDVCQIFDRDPEAIIIAIHDDGDEIVRSYGRINNITKWPTFMAAIISHRNAVPATDEEYATLLDTDFYNCADNMFMRNYLVKYSRWHGGDTKVNRVALQKEIDEQIHWFKIRNGKQPHEVNLDMYADLTKVNLDTQVFDLNIKDIVSDQFPSMLNDILVKSNLSSEFNVGPVAQVQQEYIDAQPNLQWFASYDNWNKTGNLDEYINSHIVIQAQIINLIIQRSNIQFPLKFDQELWLGTYYSLKGADWPNPDPDPHSFYDLPASVQEELINFGYTPYVQSPPNRAILKLINSGAWKTMSLQEINDIYQASKG